VYWLWWVAAAILVGAELVTGTFYLLAIGVAAAVGGIAAWVGASLEIQFLVAGGVGVALTMLAHHWRTRQPRHTTLDPRDSLDIGQTVRVQTRNADGTLRVWYRGTEWDAELASPAISQSETLYIVSMRGSRLVLADRPPLHSTSVT
jgi:membrane protein implicated in regulation of membrane protease activity